MHGYEHPLSVKDFDEKRPLKARTITLRLVPIRLKALHGHGKLATQNHKTREHCSERLGVGSGVGPFAELTTTVCSQKNSQKVNVSKCECMY